MNLFRVLVGRRQFDLLVLVMALLVLVGVLAFVLLAARIKGGEPLQFDKALLKAPRVPDDLGKLRGPAALAEWARDLTALGGVPVLTLIIAAVLGFLALHRKWGAVVFLLVAVVGGFVVSTVMKRAFERPRPDIVPHLSFVTSSSFPSGHSMLSAITYLTLGVLLARLTQRKVVKVYFIAVALILTGLTGLSRVLMGVHWPTDVLGGWIAGLIWALICWLAVRYLQHEGAIDRSMTPPRETFPRRIPR